MNSAINALRLNGVVSKRIMRSIILGQLGFLAAVWLVSPSKILPTPWETVVAFRQLWAEGMGGELAKSVSLNLTAVAWATAFSLLFAYSTRIPFLRPIATVFSDLRYLSLAGITLGFTVLMGGTYWLKVGVLAFAVSVFFVRSMVDVIRSIPTEQYDLARTLRMNEAEVTYRVVVVEQLPQAFDILRQNAAMSWMMLPFAESLVWSQGGIGVMLLDSTKHFRLESILAIQITITLCGLLQDAFFGICKKIVCPAAELRSKER